MNTNPGRASETTTFPPGSRARAGVFTSAAAWMDTLMTLTRRRQGSGVSRCSIDRSARGVGPSVSDDRPGTSTSRYQARPALSKLASVPRKGAHVESRVITPGARPGFTSLSKLEASH